MIDLPPVMQEIISCSPDIVSLDFGSFDSLDASLPVISVARAFREFVRYLSFLFASRHARVPVIIILEQHFWQRAPGYWVPSNVLHCRFLQWNLLWYNWSAYSPYFYFLRLISLSGVLWPAELILGHLLSDAVMHIYVLNVLHAPLIGELILACEYPFTIPLCISDAQECSGSCMLPTGGYPLSLPPPSFDTGDNYARVGRGCPRWTSGWTGYAEESACNSLEGRGGFMWCTEFIYGAAADAYCQAHERSCLVSCAGCVCWFIHWYFGSVSTNGGGKLACQLHS